MNIIHVVRSTFILCDSIIEQVDLSYNLVFILSLLIFEIVYSLLSL